MTEFLSTNGSGKLHINPHEGQYRALTSDARFVFVIAGTQSGKTVLGPVWMYQEIQRSGPGDYFVVTPTFPLLELRALPEFKKLFEITLDLGEYKSSPVRRFEFSEYGLKRVFKSADDPCTVYFGYAADPDSLESATAKAAWIDECGQDRFKLDSWEAIQRRLSINQGRVLATTTPYNLGWLKQQVYDRWLRGDDDFEVINFDSITNPAFPEDEYERARRTLPGWKFRMFYQGLFERPAGMIYDAFDEQMCKVPRFSIPHDWKRFLGLDFGGVNLVGVFFAEEPETGKLYLYRTYHEGGRTAKEHVEALKEGEIGIPTAYGGAKSEQQWRDEFAAAGLPVRQPPVSDVEVGISRVYGQHKQDQIMVFEDLAGYLDEKMSYSRETDNAGNVTEKIKDKNTFHHMDAERYIISSIRGDMPESTWEDVSGLGEIDLDIDEFPFAIGA